MYFPVFLKDFYQFGCVFLFFFKDYHSLAVFSCISLSELLNSFLMSSTIIIRYAFNFGSSFLVVLGCPGLGGVGVLRSDDGE